MKKLKIVGLIILIGMSLSSCTNLDESSYIKPNEQSIICSETFALGLGAFTTRNIAGTQEWSYNSNGYVGMSGYVSPNYYVNEDWLISPVIDLTDVEAANVSFDYVAHMLNLATDATLWVSETYTNDSIPSVTNMTQLQVNLVPDPANYVFTNSGQVSLTKYAGKKIRIAIKYISSSSVAGAFELKNFVVAKGEAIVNPSLLYSESLYSSLGNFTTQNVLGNQTWYADSKYSCITMAGAAYVNPTDRYPTSFANEDWLISPEIDLTNTAESYFSFDHSGKYFGNVLNEATVWVSDNYTSGLPATANWVKVYVMNYFNSFTFVTSGRLSLNAYNGKKVHVAFKYTSTTSAAGTWELRNFQVFKGQAGGDEAFPLKIKDAVIYQSGSSAWVQGYVVGYAWPFMSQYAYFNSVDTCTQKLNVILADTITNTYTTNCLAVQLPRGSLRNLLNLKDNHGRIGQKIKLYGTLSPSMGISGMTSVTKYVLPDSAGSALPTTSFSETFASGLGSFTQTSVVGTSQYWKYSSGFGATMSGYAGSNIPNEDWLYSPEIDLTSLKSAALTFDHTINKGNISNMKTEQTLWISAYDGVNWLPYVQVTIPNYPAGNNWTFVNSGEIDLDAYAGKKIKLAFKYTCTNLSSATWEIKNFKIYY